MFIFKEIVLMLLLSWKIGNLGMRFRSKSSVGIRIEKINFGSKSCMNQIQKSAFNAICLGI